MLFVASSAVCGIVSKARVGACMCVGVWGVCVHASITAAVIRLCSLSLHSHAVSSCTPHDAMLATQDQHPCGRYEMRARACTKICARAP